jgi:hypothetical protein
MARNVLRPMRPKPLMPTLMAITGLLLQVRNSIHGEHGGPLPLVKELTV